MIIPGKMCFLVALISSLFLYLALKKNAMWLLDFTVRIVYGTLGIFCTNYLLCKLGFGSIMPLSLESVLTTGILGITGFAALFVVGFLKSM